MPDPRVEDLERAAALHWRAPETEPLGEWRLRAAEGFTGRANSALPVGDPGLPLPEAVAAVEAWYRRRDLRPMIVLPQGAGPDPLPQYLAERSWVPRPGPAFVMTADVAGLSRRAPRRCDLAPEPDAALPSRSPPGRPQGAAFPPRSFVARQSRRHRGPLARGCPRPRRPAARTVSQSPQAHPVPRQPLPPHHYPAAGRGGCGPRRKRVLLQVETGNAPARALDSRCGFRESHRYHYMLAP